MKKMKKIAAFMLVLTVGLVITACASSGDSADDPIVIYDGEFSEMKLMHQMAKMLVEDHTDVEVEIKDEMAPVNSFEQMADGKADMMNSYDGTLLTTFLHMDMPDVPDDMTTREFVNEKAMEEHGIRLLEPVGSENTYAIGLLEEKIEEYDLETISDLAEVADELVFDAEHDFYTEEGSMKYTPFIKFQDLEFKDNKPIDINLKYSAIESGNIDVTPVYTTDGLTKEVGLVTLEDDQDFFPDYNTALLVGDDIFDRYSEVAPDLEEVLNKLADQFTNEIMTDLTYEVNVEEESEEDVAR